MNYDNKWIIMNYEKVCSEISLTYVYTTQLSCLKWTSLQLVNKNIVKSKSQCLGHNNKKVKNRSFH